MNDDRLRLEELLAQLRTQLSASTTLDPALRGRLEQTLGDVQQALSAPGGLQPAAARAGTAKPGAGPQATGPLGKRLSEAAIGFEVSHPALANTLGSLIDALGGIGI